MIVGPLAIPATVIFLGLMVGGMLLVLSWMLQGFAGDGETGNDPSREQCARCRHANPTHARYCGRCGHPLG